MEIKESSHEDGSGHQARSQWLGRLSLWTGSEHHLSGSWRKKRKKNKTENKKVETVRRTKFIQIPGGEQR